MIPGFLELVSEERTSRTEEQAAGVTFQADRTEIKPFESPVSKLRAQTGLQVWHSQQGIPEFVEQALGEAHVVVNVGRSREKNREERKCGFGAHGREFQQQTALANSPIAENRERTRSTCRQSLLQGLAERLNVLPPANKLVRSDWEIGLRTHVGPPKSQSDACQ